MATDLATVRQLRDSLELPERDLKAAEAVAGVLRFHLAADPVDPCLGSYHHTLVPRRRTGRGVFCCHWIDSVSGVQAVGPLLRRAAQSSQSSDRCSRPATGPASSFLLPLQALPEHRNCSAWVPQGGALRDFRRAIRFQLDRYVAGTPFGARGIAPGG